MVGHGCSLTPRVARLHAPGHSGQPPGPIMTRLLSEAATRCKQAEPKAGPKPHLQQPPNATVTCRCTKWARNPIPEAQASKWTAVRRFDQRIDNPSLAIGSANLRAQGFRA